ncbi:SDR family NAD(P)-dependent oxidoreductase [Mycolicibacterium austroafricanum]|uniref:SDR family NAD(P)-dependent oxidoreductase n=1 Tax=Mycolicibacterium austroafricanum TaxID=39687 RepID=UPI001CA32E02|nr:SDR family NAD(P)-dependent oxidoreductase [Mycolicibacterium austroafricanum]QZT58571.1 SDR family NAD(P)-dependent oxidoreductase [Mycolicibacterium austroafricanum]
MRFDSASAIVTGGASGLGLATATRLSELGVHVVVLDLPSSAGGQVARDLSGTFIDGDVTDEEAAHRAVTAAAEQAPLRIVVNCAGVGKAGRTVGKDGAPYLLDDFKRVVGINLFGTFNVLSKAAAAMAQAHPVDGERGVIVNTASVAAFEGQIGQCAYSASKGGIVGMTLPIARDLAALKIRIVTIAPGLFDTPLLGRLPQEARDSLGGQVPHPSRLGAPAEYGQLVESIIANPMLNGEVIRLDGAIRMAPR